MSRGSQALAPAHPSIANGRLHLRHGEYLLAYDIKAN